MIFYAFYGLNNDQIIDITNDLMLLDIDTKVTVEYIEKNSEKIYLRVIARYIAYKWIISSIWFISVFFIKIEMHVGPKIPEAPWMKVLQDLTGSYIIPANSHFRFYKIIACVS